MVDAVGGESGCCWRFLVDLTLSISSIVVLSLCDLSFVVFERLVSFGAEKIRSIRCIERRQQTPLQVTAGIT